RAAAAPVAAVREAGADQGAVRDGARRSAASIHLAARAACGGAGGGTRAHCHGMVEAGRQAADAGLFPRGGCRRPAFLDLSRWSLRQRARRRRGQARSRQLVCAWAVRMKEAAYAEIGVTTNFSFLRGGSDPRAYVHQASQLGIPAIGIADHNTLAGVVRAYSEL